MKNTDASTKGRKVEPLPHKILYLKLQKFKKEKLIVIGDQKLAIVIGHCDSETWTNVKLFTSHAFLLNQINKLKKERDKE